MARIIYTGIVTSINGSIAGTTFQRSAYGHTIKKKPTIVNPNRPKQQFSKAAMQAISGAWLTLTPAVRSAWAAYALSFPVPSRLNPSAILSGHALFNRINFIRLAAGDNIFTTSPSMVADTIAPPSINVYRSGGNLIYLNDYASSLNNMQVSCYISGTVKVTQLYDRTKTRFMGTFKATITDHVDITAAYTAQFGGVPATSDYVFVRTVYWSRVNGQVIDSLPTQTIVG
jgi:hypothetical protein